MSSQTNTIEKKMINCGFKPLAYQCKRSVCKKADNPSIMTKIAKVQAAQAAKITYRIMAPVQLSLCKPFDKTMFHNTSDNSEKNHTKHRQVTKDHTQQNKCRKTHEHEQETKPTNGDRKRCARLYSKRIQWYELIDG